MPGVNGVQGSKTLEVQNNQESTAPAQAEYSTPKTVDTFEPGQARTAKGEAYLKLLEREKNAPGEARTAKGEAYLKMMQAEAAAIQNQPGDAPRAKKQSVQH
mgnify:CR=1 FL=1